MCFLVFAIFFFVSCNAKHEGFYNIGHMTNNFPSVDWAVEQGANSLELDLQFQEDGTPYKFFHSPTCDCSCMCPSGGCSGLYPNSVCVQLQKTSPRAPCNANADAVNLLRHVASKRRLAMVMIDSKLTDGGKRMSESTLQIAGKKVIKLLEDNLFKRGFNGEVVIGAPGFSTLKYIKEISKTKSPYKERIHFTIDMEDISETKQKLDFPWNKNVVYNVGLSACSPTNKATFKTSKLAAINKVNGVFGMTYTWSVDKVQTMRYYINYFNGIITNYPGSLATLLKKENVRLATPSDRILPSTSSEVITSDKSYLCECTYHSGGCKVTKKAPKGLACQCTYPFLWTCAGWVVLCRNPDSAECQNPSHSKESCQEGRGNCGGY